MLHYADQPCFPNAFKKATGMSPNENHKSNTTDNRIQANLHNKILLENETMLPFKVNIERH